MSGDLLGISNEYVEVFVAPTTGGRVVRLTDRPREMEWLVPSAVRRSRPALENDSWADYPRGGWDECLPSIEPAKLGARWCNDHGDLWSAEWEVVGSQDAVITRVAAPDDSYAVTRRLSLDGPSVRIDYALRVNGPDPLSYLWSMHPLLPADTDIRATLQHGTEVVVGYCTDERIPTGTTLTWGDPVPELDHLPLGQAPDGPLAMKLFARTPAQMPLTATRGQSALAFGFDSRQIEFVGLWLNYGAWPTDGPPDSHLAIEPTTAATDDLATAQARGQAKVVSPGGSEQWSVTLTVEAAS